VPVDRPARFNEDQRQQIAEQFKKQFNKTVLVFADGSATVFSPFSTQKFKTVEEAWKHCQTL
jgi:hypothetical protein